MTREEAIKVLLESKDNDIERTRQEWEEWDKRFFEAVDMAIEALRQPEQQWIPCSERLPEEYGRYLTFHEDGRMEVGTYSEYGWGFGHYVDAVCAWQPLPEPWKGDADGTV